MKQIFNPKILKYESIDSDNSIIENLGEAQTSIRNGYDNNFVFDYNHTELIVVVTLIGFKNKEEQQK